MTTFDGCSSHRMRTSILIHFPAVPFPTARSAVLPIAPSSKTLSSLNLSFSLRNHLLPHARGVYISVLTHRSARAPRPIVVGHKGPAGLGTRHFDPCGDDWEPKAGDNGDPDRQSSTVFTTCWKRRTVSRLANKTHPTSIRPPLSPSTPPVAMWLSSLSVTCTTPSTRGQIGVPGTAYVVW